MIVRLPRLTQLRAGAPSGKTRRIIVFVHGIFSSHETFTTLVDSFERDARFDAYDLAGYDYDWGEPILESAQRLRSILNRRVPEGSEVTLIGHSMGGLVCRFALVAGELRGVKRLFMLGTPNFGAFTARQLSTLWQTAIAAAGRITPIFPRKAGLRDLTRPQTLYDRVALPDTSVPVKRAKDVEYITVPGLFYHEERRNTDPGPDNRALPFTVGALGIDVLASWPLVQIGLQRPHDGVVEEASVNLDSGIAGRVSEKTSAIQNSAIRGHTYCHATPYSMRECAHMGIQQDPAVASTIKGIMLANGATAWWNGLSLDEQDRYVRVHIP